MSRTVPAIAARPPVPAMLIVVSLVLLTVSVLNDSAIRVAAVGVVLVTCVALVSRVGYVSWRQLIAGLILVILFIPIRRYSLPVKLPLQLEPYRIYVALILLGGLASLLVDRRVRLRRTGFEGPLALIAVSAFASLAANPGTVAQASSEVNKRLMFFLSFFLVLYLTASVVRRLDDVDYLIKVLVGGGAVVAFFALVEARTGYNVFNHLSRVIPFLHGGTIAGAAFTRVGTGRARVFASAEHPVALSAALVMLIPLAVYLARRHAQRRWIACAVLMIVGCAATVSRTGVLMLVVAILVFLWIKPRETRRLWPALIPALVVVHVALPGTLGSIKNSFMPPGGLVKQQQSQAGDSGSGRIADLGPGLREWRQKPFVGEGFGTRVVDTSDPRPKTNILDDQWLGTLLETGALGFIGWLWFFIRVVRKLGKEAKRDESPRGWLLASIAAAVAAYAAGMLTYDAFSFIQVTFLLFILVGLGSALLAEQLSQPSPQAMRIRRQAPGDPVPASGET